MVYNHCGYKQQFIFPGRWSLLFTRCKMRSTLPLCWKLRLLSSGLLAYQRQVKTRMSRYCTRLSCHFQIFLFTFIWLIHSLRIFKFLTNVFLTVLLVLSCFCGGCVFVASHSHFPDWPHSSWTLVDVHMMMFFVSLRVCRYIIILISVALRGKSWH